MNCLWGHVQDLRVMPGNNQLNFQGNEFWPQTVSLTRIRALTESGSWPSPWSKPTEKLSENLATRCMDLWPVETAWPSSNAALI